MCCHPCLIRGRSINFPLINIVLKMVYIPKSKSIPLSFRAGIYDEYGVMRLCHDVTYPQVRSYILFEKVPKGFGKQKLR